ncbi:MAG: glycosyltransferase [Candidatus Binatia bacterium]
MLGLTAYLSYAGHRSEVACDPDGELSHRLQERGLPWLPLRVHNHIDVPAAWRLHRLVRKNRYDLVHFHTARAHALSPWLSGLQVKRVVTRRMDYGVKKSRWTHLLYGQSVDAVVAISTGVRAALLAGGVPAAHIRLIPSGVDTARFMPTSDARARVRQAYGLGEQETVVLLVGALVERKGHRTVLAAARQLQTQGIRLRYLLCGEGPLRASLQAEAQALRLEQDVVFAGFCHDIPDYLAAADFFVHVPLWEGLGVAVIEALAAGLPVVASRVGGIPELIEDNTTGLLVPPQDPTALASALNRLICDPLWAGALGRAGQAVARARFDMAIMAKANEELYKELLGE